MIFFTKKNFLADQLEGLTDIHNHVLPGIDDGASDSTTSLEMIKLFKELGYKGCIATPHTMEDYYGNDTNTITTCFETFKTESGDFIKSASSEYMMDGKFETLIKDENVLFLKERILLTEFSYFQKPDYVNDALFTMSQKDIDPILAHPERYRYIKGLEEYQDLKERGFEFQLNLLSLSGHYGKDAFAKAKLLLDNGLYDYIGTDAHKPLHLEKLKEIKLNEKLLNKVKVAIDKTKSIF